MKKFFVIALVLHSLLFLNYNRYQTLGDPNISVRTNIPISYNVISAEQRLDGINQIKGGEEKQPEPEPEIKKEENVPKIEKKDEPEIKSKMSKDKKKEEVKKEEKKSENPKQAKKTKKETTEK